MVLRGTPHTEQFDLALQGWTDERFISRDYIRAVAMFGVYLVNLAEADGWSYYGHSWKEGVGMGCLVVKATREGTPQVVFVNARTYIGSIVTFLRLLDVAQLDWRDDKYRQ